MTNPEHARPATGSNKSPARSALSEVAVGVDQLGAPGQQGRWKRIGLAVAVVAGLLVLIWLTNGLPSLGRASVIGLTENAPLVLAAIGFALLYRLTGLINVAYAETITLGAYFAVTLNNVLGWDFFATLVPAGLLAGVFSVVTYLVIYRPAKLRGVGQLEMIIISFGLSVALRYGLQLVFTTGVRNFTVGPTVSIDVVGNGVSLARLVAVGSVIALAIGLYFFIQRSRFGLMVRALAGDESLAQVSGIRPFAVTVMIWFIAGLAGGLAGAFLGVGASIQPDLGWREFLLILLIVLIGGIWGLNGVLWVGLATGVALTFMTLTFGQPFRAEVALILAFLVILKLRGRRLTENTKV